MGGLNYCARVKRRSEKGARRRILRSPETLPGLGEASVAITALTGVRGNRRPRPFYVDEVDADLLGVNWCEGSGGYIQRSARRPDGGRTTEKLHRVIAVRMGLDLGSELVVDHKNGDPADNRRENLRSVSQTTNHRNGGPMPSNKSGYRGVSWCKRAQKWWASITHDGRIKSLGYHHSTEAANRARCQAELRLWGEIEPRRVESHRAAGTLA